MCSNQSPTRQPFRTPKPDLKSVPESGILTIGEFFAVSVIGAFHGAGVVWLAVIPNADMLR
jgi:hypothetical protein